MTNNKNVTLVLGGTKGLGKEIALRCVFEGDDVIVTGSSFSKEYTEDGITYIPCDLSSMLSVNNFLAYFRKQHTAPIKRFFWCAGRLIKGDFGEQSDNDILTAIDINFRNPSVVAKAVWQNMQKSKEGCQFVVVSSSSGTKARKDEAVYVATKHAQVGFAKSLGMENNNPNVHVALVMPGGMKTSFWDKNPSPDYDSFLNPKHVAQNIVTRAMFQDEFYDEYDIPRGSLDYMNKD